MTTMLEPALDQQQIKVRVLFFGAARDAAGHSEVDLSLPTPINAADAFQRVLSAYPELRRFGRSLLFAVNQEYAPTGCEVQDGDELAVFPPVSGGGPADTETGGQGDREMAGGRRQEADGRQDTESAGTHAASTSARDFFELTTEPIDVGSVARRVIPRECGATVTLDGYAREWTRGRRTLYLIYEAYAPMAVSEMQ